jgi:hypothetical protein
MIKTKKIFNFYHFLRSGFKTPIYHILDSDRKPVLQIKGPSFICDSLCPFDSKFLVTNFFFIIKSLSQKLIIMSVCIFNIDLITFLKSLKKFV